MDAPFSEEQKTVLRRLAVDLDAKFRRVAVRFFAVMKILKQKRVATLQEIEAAIAEAEVDLVLDSAFDPAMRSIEDLLCEGPQEEKG